MVIDSAHEGDRSHVAQFNPDELERRIPVTALGTIRCEDLEAASRSWAPGLEAYFWEWGRGITVSADGIPLRDWRQFLAHLRRAHRL